MRTFAAGQPPLRPPEGALPPLLGLEKPPPPRDGDGDTLRDGDGADR